jgi:Protein of unknown function (DUF3606)
MTLACVAAKEVRKMDRNDSLAKRRIHTDADCYDLMYWSIRFGVSLHQLLEAVEKVGPLVPDVERHLNASAAMSAEPMAANPVRHVLHFEALGGAGLADRKIVQPDPSVFALSNDQPPAALTRRR